MQTQENKKKLKKEIIAVIAVAALCVVIAAVFVIQYAVKTYNEEKAISEFSEKFGQKLQENSEKAEELKGSVNTELVGTYQSMGEFSGSDQTQAVGAMQLLPDGKAVARTFGNADFNGWWTSSQKDGVDFVAIGLDGKSDVLLYQRSGSYLMDVKSIYYGEVKNSSTFDTTFISESSTGKMTMELKSDGSVSAEFIDTNENSQNNGVKFALRGKYSVDGKFIDIVLNGVQTRFLTFDYGMDNANRDSGLASIYFEKID